MLLIFFILTASTVFCLLVFSTNLFMMHYCLERRKNNERLVLSFGFVWFILSVIIFVYNGLKQNLILQTNANCFLHISSFIGIMRKKKLTKFVYFLETMMYKCLIFWTNIMVHINFVVNFVLFWRVYARETPLDLNKTWVDNVRFSTSVVCTKN